MPDLVDRLGSEMEVLCGHSVDCDRAPGFARATYCVRVSPAMFDVIFNSEHGLRTAYYESPDQGDVRNRLFLDAVTPKLVD